MGRITVFTSDDSNSRVVCKALESRDLPYVEISLSKYPSRRNDLQALTGNMAVPAVFFNTVHIQGGVDDVLIELKRWDLSKSFSSPLEKYQAEIASMPDPSNPKLAVPTNQTQEKDKESTNFLPKRADIQLMDGTRTTYFDMMERLKGSLQMTDTNIKGGTVYKNVFSGASAIQVFKQSMNLTSGDAIAFGERLMDAKMICSVNNTVNEKLPKMVYSNTVYFRLQCYMEPQVINSYRIHWEENVLHLSPVEVLSRLHQIMSRIQADSIDRDSGLLDCIKCASHKLFPQLEEEMSELQIMDFSKLKSENEKLAFALNMYKLMVQYAFIKVGIPLVEADRIQFLTRVQFKLSHHTFSLQEWIDGVLRCNKKSFTNKIAFNKQDPRNQFSLKKFDRRIHFAINVGSSVGSRVSPPFDMFTAENIETELEIASRVFFVGGTNIKVNFKTGEIELPKFIGWYRHDFAGNKNNVDDDLIKNLLPYMNGSLSSNLRSVMAAPLKPTSLSSSSSSGSKITFNDVNWGQTYMNFSRYEKENLKADIKGVKALLRRFRPAKETKDERLRMDTLRKLNLLDTLPEEKLDRITRAVQIEFGVPMCYISLVATDRQWFKSRQCACPMFKDVTETARDISFCGHAIHQDDILLVNDALLDDRFADGPFVQGAFKLRFYAGVPLALPNAQGGKSNIGTLCITDQRPRDFSPEDVKKLKAYTRQVVNEILQRDLQSVNSANHFFL